MGDQPAEGEIPILGPEACYICGGHHWASFHCAQCNKPICLMHTKEGKDGEPYCLKDIGAHT